MRIDGRAGKSRVLGILGGMGPLASAEFVATLYRLNTRPIEQEAPLCILYSDPSVPDRTALILEGDLEPLARRLAEALEVLRHAGAGRILIACVTIHHVLPLLPEELRSRILSLVDLTIEEALANPMPRLLLATQGTREARLFERHPRWSALAPLVRFPSEADQQELHAWIYRLKRGEPAERCLRWVEALARRYQVQGCVFGCTELHLLQRLLTDEQRASMIDPLQSAARLLPLMIEIDGIDSP